MHLTKSLKVLDITKFTHMIKLCFCKKTHKLINSKRHHIYEIFVVVEGINITYIQRQAIIFTKECLK